MIRSCPHNGITEQRLVHGGVSSHNKMSLDVACGGNLMLNLFAYAIKIIKDMCSNPYNNSWDEMIMKRGINQVGTNESQT